MAGLDYWPHVRIEHRGSLRLFMEFHAGDEMFFFFTRGKSLYTDVVYAQGCHLVFGKETIGLPEELIRQNLENTLYLSMWGRVRKLNLSTAVGITVYEAYRQFGFGRPVTGR
ncbi:MAG TPA: hypothetical protein EYP57_09630 [Thermodesulfobacteriaceae bacterium]|nr:hypothetical protein [Thermodesulfobacteriaceae bacterium]